VDQQSPVAAIEEPLGHYSARIDEKGRLKLPVDMQKYLSETMRAAGGTQDLFLTTLDLKTILIYPRMVWKRNLEVLKNETESQEDAADLAFVTNELGGASEIDAQGRLLVPAKLRRELNMENRPVHLACYNERIEVMGPEDYEERRQRSRERLREKVATFTRKGLK
jgi:DNA-binding transcriptional regulator/RsmH inhibitor MraZ